MKRQHIDTNIIYEPKKIVLLGDGCIGKSTLFNKLNNLNDNEYTFPKKYRATENFDFNRINIKTNVGTAVIDLWDTAGQENYGGKIRDAYLKGADGILLLYDISEPKTVTNITKWLDQINKTSPNIPVAVLGNKADKFNDLQQTESVKLRECNLQRDLGHSKVKNYLISIKEDIHIETVSKYWSSYDIEKQGCLIGLEYILTELYKKKVVIE